MPPSDAYLGYSDAVETPSPGEGETIDRIIASMTHASRKVATREQHAVRASHAKANAVLKGELRVFEGLPADLTPGLFAAPRTYPVVVRMAQGPGEHFPDSVSTHRGLAIKVLGVDGPSIPGHAGERRISSSRPARSSPMPMRRRSSPP